MTIDPAGLDSHNEHISNIFTHLFRSQCRRLILKLFCHLKENGTFSPRFESCSQFR